MAAVFQRNTGLLFIKWNLFLFYIGIAIFVFVYKTVDHFITDDGFLNNLFAVVQT